MSALLTTSTKRRNVLEQTKRAQSFPSFVQGLRNQLIFESALYVERWCWWYWSYVISQCTLRLWCRRRNFDFLLTEKRVSKRPDRLVRSPSSISLWRPVNLVVRSWVKFLVAASRTLQRYHLFIIRYKTFKPMRLATVKANPWGKAVRAKIHALLTASLLLPLHILAIAPILEILHLTLEHPGSYKSCKTLYGP